MLPLLLASSLLTCAPYGAIVGQLQNRYDETKIASGLSQQGVMELFVSDSGSWTLLFVTPDDNGASIVCDLAVGNRFKRVGSPL